VKMNPTMISSVPPTARAARCTRRRRHLAAQRGVSIVEGMVAAVIGITILSGTVACMIGATGTVDRCRTLTSLQTRGGTSADEMFYQLRGCSAVLASQSLNSVTYSTSASSVVFGAPGLSIDANGNADILSVTDYFAYAYSSDNKKLYETLVPGTGSYRKARTNYTLASNVSGVTFTYKVRDQFTATATGSVSQTLKQTATGTPTAYVNGVQGTCTYSSGTVTVSGVTKGDDIEVIYPISPTNTSALASVTQVDATVTLAQAIDNRGTRTVTLNGTSRLRNVRN